ncbi:MAG: hypothetical protein PHH02_04505 [Dehalococcoidales bacterium]|nr:hypothetical protein [Dehalococcoidales bacterium]
MAARAVSSAFSAASSALLTASSASSLALRLASSAFFASVAAICLKLSVAAVVS